MSFFLRKTLSHNQHGFIFGRITTTNLSCFLNTAAPIACNQGQLEVVYFYLSKAFDVGDYNVFFMKLSGSGMKDSLFQWVSSYSSARENQEFYKGAYSKSQGASEGVPSRVSSPSAFRSTFSKWCELCSVPLAIPFYSLLMMWMFFLRKYVSFFVLLNISKMHREYCYGVTETVWC